MISVYYTGQEAWRKRHYPAHFVSKLSDSDSEACPVKYEVLVTSPDVGWSMERLERNAVEGGYFTGQAETQVWLDFALDCGYISQQDHDALYETYDHVAGGLVKMMSNPSAWCGPSQLREPSLVYYTHTPTPPYSDIDADTDEE